MKQQPADAPSGLPKVSVIIPCRNAADTIEKAIDSVLSQDYAGLLEVIVANASDNNACCSKSLQRLYPSVKFISNPEKLRVPGFNAGVRVATGSIIARCDAHACLPPDYLRRAVETIARTGAANVGGRQQPVGTTFFERAVAIAMTSPIGAGDARYRLGGPEGPCDTVYLGVFRREALDAANGYNPSLYGNEDFELNYRLRQQGLTVWFDPRLAVQYRPRGTLRALARQYFNYGRMKSAMLLQHPKSLQARQVVAPLLVLGMAASLALAWAGAPWIVAAALPLAYSLVLTTGAAVAGVRRRSYAALLLPLTFAAMHLSWGLGFFLPYRRLVQSDGTRSVPSQPAKGDARENPPRTQVREAAKRFRSGVRCADS